MLALVMLTKVPVPEEPQSAHQRGLEFYKHQDYVEAISAFEEAAKSESPGSTEYKESALLIGQSYFQLSQAAKAIPWLEKVPNSNEANYMLGYAYVLTGQIDRSTAAFARLFAVDPKSAAAHLVAGQMLIKKEYESQALEELKKAMALDPKLPETHFLLGEIAIYQGRFDDAIEAIHQELALNPNFSMAWYRLGDAYTRQEKWDAAIPNLQRAVWLNQDFSGPYILLGKCYFKTANYSNAEGILRHALQLDPKNASATYLLGQTLVVEGKKEEGKALLDKWKELQQGREEKP